MFKAICFGLATAVITFVVLFFLVFHITGKIRPDGMSDTDNSISSGVLSTLLAAAGGIIVGLLVTGFCLPD